MRKSLTLLFILAVAGGAQAQEAEEREESRPEPTHRIKVLQHPYDIASFYRSSEERNYFGYQPLPEVASRYPIAGYYRSQQQNVPYGYGPFWGGGYGYGSRPSGLSIGYRQRIGERGELFLFFPTFLAPVGPLAGAFFEK
jgi:hypothetical protein